MLIPVSDCASRSQSRDAGQIAIPGWQASEPHEIDRTSTFHGHGGKGIGPTDAFQPPRTRLLLTLADGMAALPDRVALPNRRLIMKTFSTALLCATALTFPAIAAEITAVIPVVPATFSSADAEYSKNWALATVNAGTANTAGWTGKGQTVAVFDTGINYLNAELGGKLVTGYDAVLGRVDSKPIDVQGHGSFVAGIIAAPRNGAGMEGVAFDANLMSIRIANSTGAVVLSDKNLAAGINYATVNGAGVFNNSWNSSVSIQDMQKTYGTLTATALTATYSQSLAAWQAAVDKGVIVTWAAGNDSKAQPGYLAGLPELYSGLQKGWLVAVATDQTGRLATYSDKCGLTAAWCMAAPGSNITSVLYTSGTTVMSGTSFAAPILSGAAAVLKQRWATLTGPQIIQIMLSTANKTGIYADTATYGQGMLDMAKAILPIGTVTIPGSAKAATSSVAVTSGAFGGALAGITGTMIVRDSYNRDYGVQASSFVVAQAKPFDLEQGLSGLGQRLTRVIDTGGLSLAMTGSSDNPGYDSAGTMPKFVMSLSQGEMKATAAHGLGSAHLFGGVTAEVDGAGNLAKGESVGSAYLGMAGRDAWGGAWSAPFVGGTRLTVAGVYGTVADKPTEWSSLAANPLSGVKASEASVVGAAVRVSRLVGDARLAVEGGTVHETNSVLGSVSEGMMSLGSASTQYVGFHAEMPLAGTWTAFGSYEAGRTNVQGASTSLVTGMSNLTSDSWSVGVTGTSALTDNDRLTLVVSQPMRVNGGTANLSLPTSQDENGNVSYTGYSQKMAADGREMDLQVGYGLGLSDGERVTTTAMYRISPDNIRGASSEVVGMARYQLKF